MPDVPTFVIVGAGLAGAKAAEALREEGFDGRLLLAGAEPERPYERPPLSKDYLAGEAPRAKVYVHPEDYYASQDIELVTATPVTSIDRESSQVVLHGGRRVRFDRLLLTTGAQPRRLAVPGGDLSGVHYLRDLADADALRAQFQPGRRLVVIGAGWIGAEVAATARQRGVDVTIVEPAIVPLERVLGRRIGAVYRDLHRDHGVTLLLGTGVDAFEGAGAVERVRTGHGHRVDCDLVVVGVGAVPRTTLAEDAGLVVDNGVVVNEYLQTSDPRIYAAGDVANARHPFYRAHLRVEHWANALNQGAAAARNMLGRHTAYDRLPYFFSDQYDVGMEYAGHAPRSDRMIIRGDPESRTFIAFWLDDGLVAASMSVNWWGVIEDLQSLIRSRSPVDPDQLADPDAPLSAQVTGNVS